MTATLPPSAPQKHRTSLDAGTTSKARLRVVFVGHVDHGKSTLIGRIFYDTKSLPDGKVEQIQAACKEEGMEFEYAFLLDALLEEQAQNITIDTTQIQFKTAKRPYVIIDAPGHKEFLKNMITGAASADAAVLLIAANEGVREQSRRHGYLLSLLGIRQVVVAVNKMDLVDFKQDVFEQVTKEYTAFLTEIGLEARAFVPISARSGMNVANRTGEASASTPQSGMPWYTGPTITDMLDSFEPPKPLNDLPLRFPVQDVYRFDDRRIVAGRIEAGSLKVGDTLVFSPGNKTGVVKSIENWSGPVKTSATAGESVGITLTEQIFVERGHVASHEQDAPIESNRFKARLFWMGKRNLAIGERTKLKLTTQELDAEIVSIERIIDASTLDTLPGDRGTIARNDVAEITIQTRGALAFDNADRNALLGRFVIVEDRIVAGGGIIFGGVYTDRTKPKSANIFWTDGSVTQQQRFARNNHKGAIVWFTGLSGSGKSTLSHAIDRELFNLGMQTYILDGDNVRHGLNSNLGFSPEDRVENIRRVAEVARLMADAGVVVITAFISPYQADRRRARAVACESGVDFYEVYVNASLEVCEQRDTKGLYKKARAGEIKQFTGIDAPYEPPTDPEISVETGSLSVQESVAHVLEFLRKRLKFETDFEI
ncbi:MAG: adenylyl-sulfate kinase [Chthoniobacteraceae bacterium]